MEKPSPEAWNNFVFSSPEDHEFGSARYFAVLACKYMSRVNGGGINSFLTNSYELDACLVANALRASGAVIAAEELERVLSRLGVPLLVSSQTERWDILMDRWPEDLDDRDCFSETAEAELMRALERHVYENEDFYRLLT